MGPNHFIFDASQNQYHSRRNYYAHCRQLSGWPTCLAHVFHFICLHNPVLF